MALEEDEMRVWQAFLHAYHAVMPVLDKELRAAVSISLPEYDVLLRLGRSRSDGLRVTQLAQRTLLTQSGLTRLVERLHRRGLVERVADPADRRAHAIRLSKGGRTLLRQAAAVHVRGIEAHFVARLNRDQLVNVANQLERVGGEHEDH